MTAELLPAQNCNTSCIVVVVFVVGVECLDIHTKECDMTGVLLAVTRHSNSTVQYTFSYVSLT